KTFRSLTSCRRLSSSAHAAATARRKRTMLGSAIGPCCTPGRGNPRFRSPRGQSGGVDCDLYCVGVRTVYLGTSDFAVTVLERLADSDHRPDLVVTRPDRPRGRGRKVAAPPVAAAARSLGIELL